MTAYLQSISQTYNPFTAAQNAVTNTSATQKYDTFEKSSVSVPNGEYCNYNSAGGYTETGESNETKKTGESTGGGAGGEGSGGDAKVTRKIVSRNGIKFLEITTTYPDGETTVETQILDSYKPNANSNETSSTEEDSLGELAMM